MSDELWRKGALELAGLIKARQVSSREVVEAHLRRLATDELPTRCRALAATRGLAALTHGGNASSNMPGSSSHGSRLASHQARGNSATSSGAP